MDTLTKVLIGVGGVALVGGAVYLVARKGAGLGYYAPGPQPTPRMVQQSRNGDTVTRLYKGRHLSIQERIGLIQDQVFKSVNDGRMKKIAAEVVRHCPERDGTCEAKAVFDAVKKRVRYAGDVAPIKHGRNGMTEGIDYYQTAWRTWDIGAGDCDDQAILTSTLLSLNGIQPRLRVTAASRHDDWSHIYVVAGLPKLHPSKWVALDPTLPGLGRFGVEAPYGRRADFDA